MKFPVFLVKMGLHGCHINEINYIKIGVVDIKMPHKLKCWPTIVFR